jgi:hypothetical protein
MDKDIAAIVDDIRAAYRMYVFAEKQRKRSDNAILAFLRSAFGWSKDGDDDANEAAKKRAVAMMATAEADYEAVELLAKKSQDPDGWGKRDQNALEKAVEKSKTDDPAYLSFRGIIHASIAARAPYLRVEEQMVKEMTRLAGHLPVSDWVEDVKGFGLKSLAVIVGEAGDLSSYRDKGKLWKRMAMAPYSKNGATRSGHRWRMLGGLAAEDWSALGSSPRRRSAMYVIGESLIKQQGHYREVYLARKEYLRARAEAVGFTVCPSAKIPKGANDLYKSEGEIHAQSLYYMEKRLLRDLWKAWRAAEGQVDSPYLIAAE